MTAAFINAFCSCQGVTFFGFGFSASKSNHGGTKKLGGSVGEPLARNGAALMIVDATSEVCFQLSALPNGSRVANSVQSCQSSAGHV